MEPLPIWYMVILWNVPNFESKVKNKKDTSRMYSRVECLNPTTSIAISRRSFEDVAFLLLLSKEAFG